VYRAITQPRIRIDQGADHGFGCFSVRVDEAKNGSNRGGYPCS
jgi:hypothetical protein